MTFAPQHRDVQCKNDLFQDRSPLPFLATSFPLPKATTFASIAVPFASDTYNQEVLFSLTIIARHNHAILPWLANEPSVFDFS
jgi:hypothetical protein